jgi:hypothetical protein
MPGHLLETFFEPGRPVFQGPIKQGVFKTDVVASFLALDPFVTKDLWRSAKNSLYKTVRGSMKDTLHLKFSQAAILRWALFWVS